MARGLARVGEHEQRGPLAGARPCVSRSRGVLLTCLCLRLSQTAMLAVSIPADTPETEPWQVQVSTVKLSCVSPAPMHAPSFTSA